MSSKRYGYAGKAKTNIVSNKPKVDISRSAFFFNTVWRPLKSIGKAD
jgi:hypothetical protein